MSAPPGPRASRGTRSTHPSSTLAAKSPKAGQRTTDARKTRPVSSRGNGAVPAPARASSRGGAVGGPSRRGTARGAPLYRAASRPLPNTPRPVAPTPKTDALRDATTQEQTAYRAYMEKTFRTLEEQRKQERQNAIRDGLLADPDKPTTLANAITIIGTCQDMCAEHERVQRITQRMIDDCEKVPHASEEGIKVPSEDRIVKRYRRPAAGYEEQLPSDIRPPFILQKTLDYLMDDIVGGPEPLASVHKFVWDRTRAIRNDFSIQQVTKVDELRIAISCFERIARFHILSLHQLSKAGDNGVDFDAYQEREQLNNTLLSLMYYYDDSRHKLVSPNEPEFRAYCIIFEIQDQRPDLEDRAQNWPPSILKDRRVQTALNLYAAAANTSDAQGPLRPQVTNAIAQANTSRFFGLIESPAVPYLMACVAEIYFNKVRQTALDTIWRAYKVRRGGRGKVEDWTLDDLTETLGFDDEQETQAYCEDHGFTVTEKENGEIYVDLGSVAGRYLSDANSNRKQAFSVNLVEQKRHGRTLPAIINGMTASQARAQGMVTEEYSDNEGSPAADEESLFLPEGASGTESSKGSLANGTDSNGFKTQQTPGEGALEASPTFQQATTPLNSLGPPKTDIPISTTFFGKPSISAPSGPPVSASPSQTLDQAACSSSRAQNKLEASASPFSQSSEPIRPPPSFDFGKPVTGQAQSDPSQTTSPTGRTLDPKPPSTSTPAVFSFGTSPLFTQVGASTASLPEKKGTHADFSAGTSKFKAAESTTSEPKASSSPFAFLNPTPATSSPPASTIFSVAPPPLVNREEAVSTIPQPPSSLLKYPSAPSSPFSTATKQQADDVATKPNFSFTKPVYQPPAPSPLLPPSNTPKPSEQAPSQPTRDDIGPRTKSSTSNLFEPKSSPSPFPSSTPKPSGTKAPDPRPAVLDALAEGLLMEDQGLLQQFIEYTIGPIVREAFQEVEEERPWKRAREVRTFLLERKYLQRWKATVWKRKLMRKGKERRAIFAKSMQERAKSSTQQASRSAMVMQSRSVEKNEEAGMIDSQERNVPLALQSRSTLKRKSLPTDFDFPTEKLPNAEGSHGNKRKRQDPLQTVTKNSKHSLHTSFKPNHKRSKTMGGPPRPMSFYDNLADFSQLDESTDAHEKVIRQARRLVGHAKLDSTQGDYFALKARGVDPDTPLTPQPGLKRSRVDEQLERVRKLLKPSPSISNESSSKFTQPSDSLLDPSSNTAQSRSRPPNSSNRNVQSSPNDLLAQVRQVREALAEGTAWFQAERVKSERLSSSRSSETSHNVSTARAPVQSSQIQTQEPRPSKWNPPTRSQIRLEKTKANGLLPPDWDWNKSVTDWKLRGGKGSPMRGTSKEPTARPSSAGVANQQQQVQKPAGLAATANGFGRRQDQVPKEDEMVYNDEEEAIDEREVEEADEEDVGDEYEGEEGDEGEEGEEGEDYANGYEEEYEDEEDEEEEEEDEVDIPPERAVLKGQGNSADTAIDLD